MNQYKCELGKNSFGDIIVNATALDSSGALTILLQFARAIPEDSFRYILFIHPEVHLGIERANILTVYVDAKSLIKRFLWDSAGLKCWLRKSGIKPVAGISLQNTNFRGVSNVPNFIYFHNAIPFSPIRWCPLRKDQRTLWFYSKIYPVFIRLFINRQTEIFVQSNNIKRKFADFFRFREDRISVISPEIRLVDPSSIEESFCDNSQLNLFYPSTAFIYKNHLTLFKALEKIDIETQKKITLYLTCSEYEIKNWISEIKTAANIIYLGKIPFQKMLSYYKCVDAVVFPSFIETIGLPLIEAASFGLPVLVSDFQYSRESLDNYNGSVFVEYDNSDLWKIEIERLFAKKGKRYEYFKPVLKNTWPELFKIVKMRIEENV